MIDATNQKHGMVGSIVKEMKENGLQILLRYRKTSSILVLVGANILNNTIVFLINIIVARKVGPDDFGIFSLAVSIMVATNLIADLGINLAIVRLFNLYQSDEERQKALFSSLLVWKIIIVIALILVALPLGIILRIIFSLPESHTILIALAIASGGVFGLWLFYHSYLQAHRKFRKLALFIVLCAFFRLVCFAVVYFWLTSSIDLMLTFSSMYPIPLIIAVCIGLVPVALILLKHGIPQLSDIKDNIREILNYGKWVAISGLCHSFIYRGVQFILATRTTRFELGIFSAGFVFTLAFTPFNTAVRTVFFPHVTAYKSKKDMVKHISRLKKIFPYYILITIISICCLAVIQLLFLGKQYTTALPIFVITSLSLTLTIYFGLASMLVHTLMRPEIDAYTNIARLGVASVLTFLLAPSLGSMGGALSYSIPLILGEILMVLYVQKLLYEKQ